MYEAENILHDIYTYQFIEKILWYEPLLVWAVFVLTTIKLLLNLCKTMLYSWMVSILDEMWDNRKHVTRTCRKEGSDRWSKIRLENVYRRNDLKRRVRLKMISSDMIITKWRELRLVKMIREV